MLLKKISKIQEPSNQSYQSNVESVALKAFKHCVDPHGRIIGVYSQDADKIYIISILHVLEYFEYFQKEYAETYQYTLKKPLIPDLVIANSVSQSNIFFMKFTQSIQSTQFLVIAYYPSKIHLHSVLNGSIINRINILDIPLTNINIIGHSLFVTLYNGQMLCYQGNQLKHCCWDKKQIQKRTKMFKLTSQIFKCYPKQSIRLTYSQTRSNKGNKSMNNSDNQSESQIIEKPLKKKNRSKQHKKIVPVFQNTQGNLMMGNKIIIKRPICEQSLNVVELHQQIDDAKIKSDTQQNQLLQQFMQLEQKKYKEGYHSRYQISICGRFIIHRQQIFPNQSYQILFRFKQRKFQSKQSIQCWGTVWKYSHHPVINHFWDGKHNSWLLIASINKDINSNEITIHGFKNCQSNKMKYWQPKILYQIKQMKHQISQISWIGPEQLLLKDIRDNLYYAQIDI